jgi:hypothetical protein
MSDRGIGLFVYRYTFGESVFIGKGQSCTMSDIPTVATTSSFRLSRKALRVFSKRFLLLCLVTPLAGGLS